MKKNVIKISDKELNSLIRESIDEFRSKNGKELNEIFGINHGLRGAIQSVANGGKMWSGFKNGMKGYFQGNNAQNQNLQPQNSQPQGQQNYSNTYSAPQTSAQQNNIPQTQQTNQAQTQEPNQSQPQQTALSPEISNNMMKQLSSLRQFLTVGNTNAALSMVSQMVNYVKVLNGETIEESRKTFKRLIK